MQLIPVKKIHSFSSEDEYFVVENLMNDDIDKKWKCENLTKGVTNVVLELKVEQEIDEIVIANASSSFVKIFVSKWIKADDGTIKMDEFKMLMILTQIMTINDINRNKVCNFKKNEFIRDTSTGKWQFVKVECCEMYRKYPQFGISFIKIYSSTIGENKLPMVKSVIPPATQLVKVKIQSKIPSIIGKKAKTSSRPIKQRNVPAKREKPVESPTEPSFGPGGIGPTHSSPAKQMRRKQSNPARLWREGQLLREENTPPPDVEAKKKKKLIAVRDGFRQEAKVEVSSLSNYRPRISPLLSRMSSPRKNETETEIASDVSPVATFAAMQPTSMSGWEYASTSASAPDDRLIPTTIDEEKKMLQRAIAISIAEKQKKQPQRNPELYPVLTTRQEPEPTPSTSKSSTSTKSIIDWEKFGARPKRNFHQDVQIPSATPTESDDLWHSDDEQTKKEKQLTDTVKEFFQNAPKLIRNKLSPHFVPQLKLDNLGRIDEETSSPVQKPGSSSSEESVVPYLESSASNYSPRISPLVSPMSSPMKNETETEIASDVSSDAEVD